MEAVLALMVVEADTLPNHETQVAMVVSAAAVTMAVAEGFIYCQETKPERTAREVSETGYNRFVNSAKRSGGRA